MTVLVTGARGDVGAAVLAGLLAAGEPVRASSRAPRPGEFPDGVEVARADLASWPAALAGVRKVFLYAHPGVRGGGAEGRREAPQVADGRDPPAPVRALLDIWHELSGRQLIS